MPHHAPTGVNEWMRDAVPGPRWLKQRTQSFSIAEKPARCNGQRQEVELARDKRVVP
jgi:hypothetical protein